MRIRTLALTAALPLLTPFALPQDDHADLAQLVERQVQEADGLKAEEIWVRAGRVGDLAGQLEQDGLEAEVQRLLESEASLSEGGVLLLAGLGLQAPEPDVERLAERLAPLLSSANPDYAVSAARLLCDPQFRSLGGDAAKALVDAIAPVAADVDAAPEVRIEAAQALFSRGGGREKRDARHHMQSFLESTDPELRTMGALGLARSGAMITGDLYDELQRISLLPGADGLLAGSYLEKERVFEEGERKLKRNIEYYDSQLADAQATAGEKIAAGEQGGFEDSNVEKLQNLVRLVKQAHLEGDKVDQEQLFDAAMNGMLHSLDAHSTYLDPDTFKRFEQDLEANYGGIGAYVDQDRSDGLFTITHPIYSGPAYRAGLMSEDKIVRIDDWPTIGKSVEDIIKRLKGRPETPVKLYVWRRGMDVELIDRPTEDMAVTIDREAITIPTVQYQMLPGKIGMIVLREFSRVASQEMRQPLLDMKDQGMRGLILDLRNNPGGLLDEAVNVASLFLPKGSLVVSTESRIESTRKLETYRKPILPLDMPVIVLVNRFSASASEIVSGALQDHDRALIVGQRSFGKGSVQNLLPLSYPVRDDEYVDENGNGRHDNWEKITKDWNGNGEFDYAARVKMTIARYLLPSGRSIHHEIDSEGNVLSEGGVEPEVVVEARKYDGWRLEEMIKLRDDNSPRDYVDRYWAENQALFGELAENDRKDPSRYPGFQEFYDSLDTPLPIDDVRQMVRFEIRRRVQDARGQEFPQGDFVEDLQLQEAIRQVLARLGETPAQYDDYNATIPAEISSRQGLAIGDTEQVRATLDELNKALEGDGQLSSDALARLRELLEKRLDR